MARKKVAAEGLPSLLVRKLVRSNGGEDLLGGRASRKERHEVYRDPDLDLCHLHGLEQTLAISRIGIGVWRIKLRCSVSTIVTA